MIYTADAKTVQSVWPQAAVNNASYTCASTDTLNFCLATLRIHLGATDAALSAMKLQESDDNSTWSDVPGGDFSVSPATLPTATSDNSIYEVQVSLRGNRKRYLKPVITVGNGATGAFVSAEFILSRGEQAAAIPADQGLAQRLIV